MRMIGLCLLNGRMNYTFEAGMIPNDIAFEVRY